MVTDWLPINRLSSIHSHQLSYHSATDSANDRQPLAILTSFDQRLIVNRALTPSMPAVSGCCCSKGLAPCWSNPPFLIFDIRALWRSGLSARAPECRKLKTVCQSSMAKCKVLRRASAWNDLPEDLRAVADSAKFRQQLKTYFFTRAFNVQ